MLLRSIMLRLLQVSTQQYQIRALRCRMLRLSLSLWQQCLRALIIPRLSDEKNCSKHLNGVIVTGLMSLTQKKATDITLQILNTLVESVIINSWISHSPLSSGFIELKERIDESPAPRTLQSKFLVQGGASGQFFRKSNGHHQGGVSYRERTRDLHADGATTRALPDNSSPPAKG
jgi:hypothetical protein